MHLRQQPEAAAAERSPGVATLRRTYATQKRTCAGLVTFPLRRIRQRVLTSVAL